MREKIVFMEGGGGAMDNQNGPEFRMRKVEGSEIAQRRATRNKDISSQRRIQFEKKPQKDEAQKATSGSPLKSSYEAALERHKEPRESKWTPKSQSEEASQAEFTPAPDHEETHVPEPGGEQKKEDQESGPAFKPAPDVEEEEHEVKQEEKQEEGAQVGEQESKKERTELEGRVESLFEEGDKDGAYKIICEESGMDPESPEAKEAFEKRWAALEEGGKPHEQQDLGKLVDSLKTIPPHEREAWRGILANVGWDRNDIERAFREASEVTPAPLPEGDNGEGGIGAAPREGGGEDEGEAKIGATPLDKEVANVIKDLESSDKSADEKAKTIWDWIKEHNGGPWMAAKDTLKVTYFIAITLAFAYIWALKTTGGLSQMKK